MNDKPVFLPVPLRAQALHQIQQLLEVSKKELAQLFIDYFHSKLDDKHINETFTTFACRKLNIDLSVKNLTVEEVIQ